MFSLTVFVGSGMWALMFKTKESAYRARAIVATDVGEGLCILDDFGHELGAKRTSVHGFVLEDLELSKLAHCERALHQQRTQIMAQNLAQADTTIRNARFQNGPAMIQPVTGGRPNGGL